MTWILLVLFYGLAKGFRDVIKKKALTKNTVMEVLFVYTFIAFVFCIPDIGNSLNLPTKYYFLIAIKSFVIFLAWIFSFNAIDNLPISVYGVIDLSRIIFSTMFGIFVLGEIITINGGIGLILVIAGLVLLKILPVIIAKKKGFVKGLNEEKFDKKFVILALLSCLLNGLSGCLDKVYMKDINSSQLQFWYMAYLVIFYGLYFAVKRIKVDKSVWKNGWIWLLSAIFFLADKALFIANSISESKVTIMTLIKQSSCIIAILAGKFIFKEKNIGYKVVCALLVICGIVISTL